MDRMRLRAAQVPDAEAVAILVNTAFRPERFFTDEDRTNPDKVRALLASGKFLLLEDSGSLVGCVYLEVRVNEDTSGCWRSSPAASDPASGRA
jgi:hypothetical protein